MRHLEVWAQLAAPISEKPSIWCLYGKYTRATDFAEFVAGNINNQNNTFTLNRPTMRYGIATIKNVFLVKNLICLFFNKSLTPRIEDFVL
jgi:hypothetical protein